MLVRSFGKRVIVGAKSTRRFFDQAGRNWDNAWKMGLTPWDLKGTVVPGLVQAVEEKGLIDPKQFKNILIPGCGSGYECFYMKERGFENVTGIDLSPTAIDLAIKGRAERGMGDIKFEVADFFIYPSLFAQEFDFIFDYLFFSALDPELRGKWAESVASLLKPETGRLATLIFPLKGPNDDSLKGPPYPVDVQDYERSLLPFGFEVVEIVKVSTLNIFLLKFQLKYKLGYKIY